MDNKIGERIRALREAQGISQSDLARHLGVSRSSCNSWEIGMNYPTVSSLIALSKHFHCSVDYILCLEDNTRVDLSSLSPDENKCVKMLLTCFESSKRNDESD